MAFTPETETHEAACIAEEVVASEDADFSPANDPSSSDPSKPVSRNAPTRKHSSHPAPRAARAQPTARHAL